MVEAGRGINKSFPCFRTIQIIFTCVCSTGEEYWIGAKYGASDWVWENGMDITETFPMVRNASVHIIVRPPLINNIRILHILTYSN